MLTAAPATSSKVALVLSGGGARAAYQAGVLEAVAKVLPRGNPSPFRIMCGTSAGAINAAILAAHAGDFGIGVSRVMRAWGSLRTSSVHRTNPASVARTTARWLWTLLAGGSQRRPVSLLDNAPLREFVRRHVDFSAVHANIKRGYLDALCVTTSSYDTGRSVSFFQGLDSLRPWSRARRKGVAAELGIAHLLASAAIPFIYPPVRIAGEHYGDGAMQQMAPISPALRLGADRIFVIGVGQSATFASAGVTPRAYPSLVRIGGHILDSIFMDTLATDLECMRRINDAVGLMPADERPRSGATLRPVEALVFTPSVSLDEMAAAHAHRLPLALRLLLRAMGVGDGRTHVPSYLVTEGRYCKALMRCGFRDGMARREEICTFLGCANERARAHRGPRTTRSPAVRPMRVPMPIPTAGCSVLAEAGPLGAASAR